MALGQKEGKKIHSNYILVSESKRKVIATLKGNKICISSAKLH